MFDYYVLHVLTFVLHEPLHDNYIYDYTLITCCFSDAITCILHGFTYFWLHYIDITYNFTCMITYSITFKFTSYYMTDYMSFTRHF